MLEEALHRIEYIHELLEAYGLIKSFLTKEGRDLVNCGEIFEKLVERELNEWRGVFMWGLVVDNETRQRVKAMAHERFLSNRMSVSRWMNDGIQPSKWLVADEEEFRTMVAEAFNPNTNE